MKSALLILILPFALLFGAGPTTHLYLAEQYCEARGIQDETWVKEFIIGSLFPDIRYLGHLARESTHPPVLLISDIEATENAFEAGMKLHAWVDIAREKFVEESGIYASVIPYAKGHAATLLKFIEEEILADLYDGRQWSPLFDVVLQEERAFAVPEEAIKRWHTMVQYTFHYRVSWLLWGTSYYKEEAFGISNQTLYDWSYLLPTLAQTSLFQTHMENLLDHLMQFGS